MVRDVGHADSICVPRKQAVDESEIEVVSLDALGGALRIARNEVAVPFDLKMTL